MPKMPKFGVGLYFHGDEDPIEITRDELVALRTFDLAWFDAKRRRFRVLVGDDKAVASFLRLYRMGAG